MHNNEKTFIAKISLIMAVRMLGLFMILPVFAIYGQNYQNATPLLIGVAIGVYGITQALLQIPYGYLSDKFGRKPLLIIGLTLFLIGSIIAAKTNNIYLVILGRALQGSGAIASVLMAFLADFVATKNRAKANAIIGVQIGISFMLAIIIGPIIAERFNISGIFYLITILTTIAILLTLTLPKITIKNQYQLSILNFKEILNARLLTLDFSIFTLHLIITSIFIIIPINLAENNNYLSYLIVLTISFIGMIPFIIIARKRKKQFNVLLLSIVLIIFTQIIFYFFKLDYPQIILFLAIFFIAFNSIEALIPTMIAKITDDHYQNKRGLAMGVFSTSQFLGAFSGGIIAGIINNYFALNNIFLFNAIIASIWFLIIFRRLKWQE